MQFIPSTWRIYGRGGDIDDPHDAILAAGRLLRANGAPRNYSRALYAYNNSRLYVGGGEPVRQADRRDPYALHYLYCWGPSRRAQASERLSARLRALRSRSESIGSSIGHSIADLGSSQATPISSSGS